MLLIFIIAGCSSNDETNESALTEEYISAEINQSQLESDKFVFDAYDTEGVLHQSTEYIGRQPVVINFWGTWCPPCRQEIPELVKLYDEYSLRGIEMVSLALRNEPSEVISFANEHSMSWKMWMGSNDLAYKYDIRGVPTTIFLDSKGNELFRFIGAQDYNTFKEAFEAIL
jgi:thiol-disulfide isomerase/thioredoxin